MLDKVYPVCKLFKCKMLAWYIFANMCLFTERSLRASPRSVQMTFSELAQFSVKLSNFKAKAVYLSLKVHLRDLGDTN